MLNKGKGDYDTLNLCHSQREVKWTEKLVAP